jgi:hypothetical protein
MTAIPPRQSLKQLLRIKAGAAQRHAGSSKKKGRQSIRRLNGDPTSAKPAPGGRFSGSKTVPANSDSRSDLPNADSSAPDSASRSAQLERLHVPLQNSSGPAHAAGREGRNDLRLIRPSKPPASSAGVDGDALSKPGSRSSMAADLLPGRHVPLSSSNTVADSVRAGSALNATVVQTQPLVAVAQPRQALLPGASARAHVRSDWGLQSMNTLQSRSMTGAFQTIRRCGMPAMCTRMRQAELRPVAMQLQQRPLSAAAMHPLILAL